MIDEIKKYLNTVGGSLTENNGLYIFKYEIADRNTKINNINVSYTAKFRVINDDKIIKFNEVITEKSSGLGVGGEMTPGIGYKTESFKSKLDGREGKVSEKSSMGEKELNYSINYKDIRNTIKSISEKNGYRFKYKILPFGI